MKLNTILENSGSDTLELEGVEAVGDYNYKPFSITLTGVHVAADFDRHPYGGSYADAHHAAGFDLDSARLSSEAELFGDDDECDTVVHTYPVGTDIKQLKGYSEQFFKWLDEQAEELAQD